MHSNILIELKKSVLLTFVLALLSSLLYIGLSPVVVEANNSYRVWNWNTDLRYATIQEAINANETLDGHDLYLDVEVFYEHVIVNKSVGLYGGVWIGHPEFITTIDGNGTGNVVTVEAENVTIHSIKIINGINGICLEEADNSLLWALSVIDNAETGIFLHNSRNCTLKYSEIANNLYGIHIQNSGNNTIHHTYFVNNTYQAHVEAIDGYPSNTWDIDTEGNYWSDYEEKYPNATEIDGIWDTPYVINEYNRDKYPIVPEFPTWTSMLLLLIVLTVAIVIYK